MADKILTHAGASDEEKLTVLRRAVQQEHARLDSIVAEKKMELEEYDALMSKLDDLPKKLRHQIMVPFGSVGFMPGQIVRTNEVLMLLGDGYFVERSCYDANVALKRRVELVKQVVTNCDKERKLVSDQLQFAERLFANKSSDNAEVEIVEEYDEEKEAEFRRRRAQKAKSGPTSTKANDEIDVISRLDELEALEAENGELDGDEDHTVPEPPPGVSKEEFHRLLAKLDEDTSSDESDSEEAQDAAKKTDDLDSDDIAESEEEELPSPLVQEVASKALRKRSVTFAPNIEVKTDIRIDEPVSTIKTATELLSGRTDSILRNKDDISPRDEEALAAMKEAENRPRVLPGSQTAFSGVVVERKVESARQPDGCYSEPSTSTAEPVKRISKFKRQRARN